MTLRDRVAAARRRILGDRPSTADTAGLPVIAPARPIDLSDERAVTEVVELAMNVGEVLLDSGTAPSTPVSRSPSSPPPTGCRTAPSTSPTTPSTSRPGAVPACRRPTTCAR
ncbi:hypothetical protein [Mycolicibacterium sp. NCC-Tsukiji]|uniref:hypothetical protein n=1 Tax=Mycobacteriaceae TaxID=1762 RepID=UPI001FCED633|nr:hypothetical protein [Mycolicibacterium sp. NCC-Tsukiji]